MNEKVLLGRFLVACSWFLAMNGYYGWNWSPSSEAELIADGILFLLISMSFGYCPKTVKTRHEVVVHHVQPEHDKNPQQ